MNDQTPLITNDAVVLGILAAILGLVFYTSDKKTGFWSKFYYYVPSLLLCYFIPSVFNTAGIISGDQSKLYFVVTNFFLPACLIFLTLSVDFKGIASLGKKAITMFIASVAGVMIGAPMAIMIVAVFSPATVGGHGADAVWRGLSTIAGSWIGGGANQTAMKEVFQVSNKMFAAMVAVDIIIANIWMAILIFCAGKADSIDKWLKADNSKIHELQNRVEKYEHSIKKVPELHHYIIILAIGFGFTGLSHFLADMIIPFIKGHYPWLEKFSLTSSFFWVILLATTIGILLSFTKARKLEDYGTFKLGNVIIYFMVATIGMKMDVTAIFFNPGLFLVGAIWILIHIIIMLVVARIIRAPFFFTAVGSQSCIGGPVSAPIVASVFHPSLAPVGVLLAVLGYAIGTYGAYLTALLMQGVAPIT
jgi:uncharacterized membrane protein